MDKKLQDMNLIESKHHIQHQLQHIKTEETPDTLASILIVICTDRTVHYGATNTKPSAQTNSKIAEVLRNMATSIDNGESIEW